MQSRSLQCRRFSTSKPASSASSSSFAGGLEKPLLSGLTDELDRIAPRFDVDGENIEILQEPSDFFEALKVGAHLASLKKGYARNTLCTEIEILMRSMFSRAK